MPRKKKVSPRLNIRLSADLLQWAKDYARRNGVTVTGIIESHLMDLRAKDTDVPQI